MDKNKIDAAIQKAHEHYGDYPEAVLALNLVVAELSTQQREYFPITSVSREDLELQDFDPSNVTDDTMQELAEKMGESYTENSFWIDLEIIATDLKIKKTCLI